MAPWRHESRGRESGNQGVLARATDRPPAWSATAAEPTRSVVEVEVARRALLEPPTVVSPAAQSRLRTPRPSHRSPRRGRTPRRSTRRARPWPPRRSLLTRRNARRPRPDRPAPALAHLVVDAVRARAPRVLNDRSPRDQRRVVA